MTGNKSSVTSHYNGNVPVCFTFASAKLDSMLATPWIRVSVAFRNRS